jgi:hypothetical protein
VSQPTPGPCSSTGCPAPTEIDCIEVTKVYDSCFQTETFNNLCTPIPTNCLTIAGEAGTVATCAITAQSCSFVSAVSTGVDDFANVTFAFSLTETITLTNTAGQTCTFTVPVTFVKTVTLCAPSGTTQTCEVAGTTCGPCALIDDQVCCQLVVCIVLQSVATVQLLVPSYGFCVPAPCAVLPILPCPPSFPTNCSTTASSSGN